MQLPEGFVAAPESIVGATGSECCGQRREWLQLPEAIVEGTGESRCASSRASGHLATPAAASISGGRTTIHDLQSPISLANLAAWRCIFRLRRALVLAGRVSLAEGGGVWPAESPECEGALRNTRGRVCSPLLRAAHPRSPISDPLGELGGLAVKFFGWSEQETPARDAPATDWGETPNTDVLRICNRRWTPINTDEIKASPIHLRPSASICG